MAHLPGTEIRQAIAVDDILYLTTDNALWAAGGTGQQVRKLLDWASRGGPYARDTLLYSVFGKLFFLSDSQEHGRALWTSDGTVGGTQVLLTPEGTVPAHWVPERFQNPARDLLGFQGQIYYPGVTDAHGVELMRLSSDTVDGVPGLLRVQTGETPIVHWRDVFGAVSFELQVVDLKSGSASAATYTATENQWEIPEALREKSLRVRVRGIAADGSKGGWNQKTFDFTLANVPVIYSSPSTTTSVTPALAWAAPIGTIRTEVWINVLDRKQRVLRETIEGHQNTFTCPVLVPSQYVVWIRTHGPGGTSEWSQAAVFTVLAAGPLSLAVNADETRRMTIDWAAVAGATDYEILIRSTGAVTPYFQRSQIGPRTSWTLPSIAPGDEYTVWVRARRPGRVHSAWSEARTLLIRQAPELHASLPDLQWGAIGQATGYEIVITNVRTGVRIERQTENPSFKLDLPSPQGIYDVRIRSTYGDGTASEWIVARREILHSPMLMADRKVSTVGATPVIGWIGPNGAEVYEVVVFATGSSNAVYRISDVTGTQHRIARPLPIGDYRVWVRSHYANGSRSAWGSPTELSIGVAPVLSVSNHQLTWTADTGATRYEVVIHVIDPGNFRTTFFLRTFVYNGLKFAMPTSSAGRFRGCVRAIREEAGDQYLSRWSNPLDFTV